MRLFAVIILASSASATVVQRIFTGTGQNCNHVKAFNIAPKVAEQVMEVDGCSWDKTYSSELKGKIKRPERHDGRSSGCFCYCSEMDKTTLTIVGSAPHHVRYAMPNLLDGNMNTRISFYMYARNWFSIDTKSESTVSATFNVSNVASECSSSHSLKTCWCSLWQLKMTASDWAQMLATKSLQENCLK